MARPTLALLALAVRAAAVEPLEVVTSVYPAALLVEEVGGERVRVRTLVPPGASPHTFEPRPGDMRQLESARLFVSVGAGLDDWVEELLGAAPRDLRRLVLSRAGPSPDPHVWLDPLRVRDALAPALSEALASLDPAGAVHYGGRLEDFRSRLTALDGEIRGILGVGGARRYVAFHAAWGSFAARYGLEELSVVEASPGQEPTPRALARLVDTARAAGIRAILVEPQLDRRIAAVIAAEFGAGTILVDPLGDPRDPARSRYESLMRWNAEAFREALGGGGA